jgi:hypothetical protein
MVVPQRVQIDKEADTPAGLAVLQECPRKLSPGQGGGLGLGAGNGGQEFPHLAHCPNKPNLSANSWGSKMGGWQVKW